jgi:hypothetical protein
MANGAVKEHLEAAWKELRKDVEDARGSGIRAERGFRLNGMASKLPVHLVEALADVRDQYDQANKAAYQVLVDHFGIPRDFQPSEVPEEDHPE